MSAEERLQQAAERLQQVNAEQERIANQALDAIDKGADPETTLAIAQEAVKEALALKQLKLIRQVLAPDQIPIGLKEPRRSAFVGFTQKKWAGLVQCPSCLKVDIFLSFHLTTRVLLFSPKMSPTTCAHTCRIASSSARKKNDY
jgi:hypothetical protein